MSKKKTSRKQRPFSLDMMPIKKLKPGVKAHPHDPNVNLRDPKLIAEALIECLFDGDAETFKEILMAYYEAVNTARDLKRAGVSKRAFDRALAPDANPDLKTVMKLLAGLRLAERVKNKPAKIPKYSVQIRWSDEDNAFVVRVPELPGCMTHGDTREEAARHANEAIEGYVLSMLDQGQELPKPLFLYDDPS